jgi:hypothetical protein
MRKCESLGQGKSRPVRIPLEATSLVDAQKELEKKRTENRKGEMYLPGNRPKLREVGRRLPKVRAVSWEKVRNTRERDSST